MEQKLTGHGLPRLLGIVDSLRNRLAMLDKLIGYK